jgi:N-acetylglutamate synthase-like GNAT family acetyltransferase
LTPTVSIVPVRSAAFIEKAYAFAKKLLHFPDTDGEVLRYYRRAFHRHPDLFTCAMAGERLCGCVFASVENKRVLVGPVAVSGAYRNSEVFSAMMSRTEQVAVDLGYNTLLLGSVPDAKALLMRTGFEPYLLVQAPHPHTLETLLAFDHDCSVMWSVEEDGWAQLLLKVHDAGQDLARWFQREFSGCQTHRVYMKHLWSRE